MLSDIDEILRVSGLEVDFVQCSMVRFRTECQEKRAQNKKVLDGADRVASFQERSAQVLRCMVLKALLGVDYCELSSLLAHSALYRKLCMLRDSEDIRVLSKSELRDYSEWLPAELWVWNSELTPERVHKTLDEFKAAGFGGVFVHPRPGLVTGYLGEEWFVLWREAREHCVKLSGEVVSARCGPARKISKLHGTVGPERQQAVVEYLTVASLGHLTQKRTVYEVVHGGSLFWQREEKGRRDLCGDPAPPR